MLIGLCDGHGIGTLDCTAECFLCFFQLFDVILGHTLAGKLNGKFFQRAAYLQHITQALLGNLRNLSTLARNHEDQAFQLQFADSLTDRGTADAQTVCKLDFHQTLAWFQLTL